MAASTTKKAKMKRADPPPRRLPSYDWNAIAEQLKAEPNQWFEIFERDSVSYAVSIRNGDVAALPKDKFQVRQSETTRGRPKGHPDGAEPRMCKLWLRYIGPKKRTTNKKEAH